MRNVEKILVRRIEDIRISKDLKKYQVAEASGIDRGQFSQLMNLDKKQNWYVAHVEKIATALKTPVWQLFVDPKEVIPQNYVQLMEDYERLDPVRRGIVDDLLKAARGAKPEEDLKKKKNV